MTTFAQIVARARELYDMTDDQWYASLAQPGADGRALDALNKATWMAANGLTDPTQRVADAGQAERRTQRLWDQTAAEREALLRETLGRVYGGE